MATKPMRILFVGRFIGEGGAERHVVLSAERLRQHGYECSLFLVKRPRERSLFKEFPGEVLMPSQESGIMVKIATYLRLWRAMKNADVIFCNSELTPTYICWLFSRFRRRAFAAEAQTTIGSALLSESKLHGTIARFIYRRIKYIRCVSHGVAEDLWRNIGVPKANTEVIYGPFDLGEIRARAAEPIETEDNYIFEHETIVCVGRLARQKRFDLAVEAMTEIAAVTDAHLVILGDGDLRPVIEEQIEQSQLSTRVHVLGFRDNPYPYLAKASVFLLVSDYEGLARVLVEALTLGRPIVATDCPSGCREVLEGSCGILVPTGDVRAIRDACLRVLRDDQLAAEFSRLARVRAEDFSTEKTTDQLARFLEKAYRSGLHQARAVGSS
jgi:glycosyltransferase involved in cell wall biosynthesis